MNRPLNFEEWYEANYDELNITASELGLDMDLDFDWDSFVEREYEVYQKGVNHGN